MLYEKSDAEFLIRVGSLEGYRDFVLERGGSPQAILDQLALDESLWATPDAMIPISKYREAMNMAAEQINAQHFGLLLSQRQSFDKLGAIGYLAKHAATLGVGIEHMNAFLRAHDRSTEARLTIEGDTAFWTYRVRHIAGISDINQCELGAGLGTKFIRSNVDPRWNPEAVFFPHSAPKDQRLLSRVFRCPIYFESDVTALEFPAKTLSRPLVQAEPKLHQILLRFLNETKSEADQDVVGRVRSEILSAMEVGGITLEDIAAKLSMSRSELQRKLKAQGKTYQDMLETIRFEKAQKLLKDTGLSLTEISAALGYAQLAIFTRAFKRSAGTTPSQFRKQSQRSLSNA